METRPREYAEKIGNRIREELKSQLDSVPDEQREQVTDMVINGLAIAWNKRKAAIKSGYGKK